MDQEYPPRRVRFSPEDQARMDRLSEEIGGRLEEMAAIAARVAGLSLTPDMRRTFIPFSRAREDGARESGLSIITLPTSPAMYACAYYEDGHYTEIEVPCGSNPTVIL